MNKWSDVPEKIKDMFFQDLARQQEEQRQQKAKKSKTKRDLGIIAGIIGVIIILQAVLSTFIRFWIFERKPENPSPPAGQVESAAQARDVTANYENAVITSIGHDAYTGLNPKQQSQILASTKDLYETLYSMNLLNLGVTESPVNETERLAAKSREILAQMQQSGISEQQAASIRDTVAELTVYQIIQDYPDKIKSRPGLLRPGNGITTPR